MKVISIINYKGGVGKTTIAANLACELANRGRRILAIDLDPQCSLTFTFIKPDEWEKKYAEKNTIKYWFECIQEEAEVISFHDLCVRINNIDLICSDLGLINIDTDYQLKQRKKRYGFRSGSVRKYSYIKEELERIKEEYDAVIIDCPPNFGVVTKNAIVASDYYLIPTRFDYLSTLGIEYLNNHVNHLIERYNQYKMSGKSVIHPKLLGVVGNMVRYGNGGLNSGQCNYKTQLELRDLFVFKTMIRENIVLFGSSGEFQDPAIWKPIKHYTKSEQKALEGLKALAQEVIEKAGI